MNDGVSSSSVCVTIGKDEILSQTAHLLTVTVHIGMRVSVYFKVRLPLNTAMSAHFCPLEVQLRSPWSTMERRINQQHK